MEESQRRGRLKKNWEDIIKGDMRDCCANGEMVMDMGMWRAQIRVANFICMG